MPESFDGTRKLGTTLNTARVGGRVRTAQSTVLSEQLAKVPVVTLLF
jgi:hypothetical protein